MMDKFAYHMSEYMVLSVMKTQDKTVLEGRLSFWSFFLVLHMVLNKKTKVPMVTILNIQNCNVKVFHHGS
jgi:hypothetical protein